MTPSLVRAIDRFASKRVLVVGDAMLDSYVVGTSTRLCQEAPVPVVAVHERRDCPGGAANTAVNLAALGCTVGLVSAIGADHEGDRLLDLLRRHRVGTSLVTVSTERQTLSKQRIVNGDRLLARIDQGDTGPVPPHLERRLLERLEAELVRADALVISDYGYGVVTAGLLRRLRSWQARSQQLFAVDARDLTRYRPIGVTVVKPNYGEALRLVGQEERDGPPRAELAAGLADAVLELTGSAIAAITLDADGALVAERGRRPHRTYADPAEQSRTAGAGDTYLAALTLALAAGATTRQAAEIAACAAGVVVRRDGTSACTADELRRALRTARALWPVSELTSPAHHGPGEPVPFEERDGNRPGHRANVGERRTPALHQA